MEYVENFMIELFLSSLFFWSWYKYICRVLSIPSDPFQELPENLVPQSWYPKNVHSGTILYYMLDQSKSHGGSNRQGGVRCPGYQDCWWKFPRTSARIRMKRDRGLTWLSIIKTSPFFHQILKFFRIFKIFHQFIKENHQFIKFTKFHKIFFGTRP